MDRRIYHVAYQQCTDYEPTPGWYVAIPEQSHPVAGPFATRAGAEDWADDHADLMAGRG